MILAQTRAGAGTALLMGGTLGAVFVPAVGWWHFLAWYLPLVAVMLARQPYFRRVLERDGANEATLRHIAYVTAASNWLLALSVPLFASALAVADLGVLTIVAV